MAPAAASNPGNSSGTLPSRYTHRFAASSCQHRRQRGIAGRHARPQGHHPLDRQADPHDQRPAIADSGVMARCSHHYADWYYVCRLESTSAASACSPAGQRRRRSLPGRVIETGGLPCYACIPPFRVIGRMPHDRRTAGAAFLPGVRTATAAAFCTVDEAAFPLDHTPSVPVRRVCPSIGPAEGTPVCSACTLGRPRRMQRVPLPLPGAPAVRRRTPGLGTSPGSATSATAAEIPA